MSTMRSTSSVQPTALPMAGIPSCLGEGGARGRALLVVGAARARQLIDPGHVSSGLLPPRYSRTDREHAHPGSQGMATRPPRGGKPRGHPAPGPSRPLRVTSQTGQLGSNEPNAPVWCRRARLRVHDRIGGRASRGPSSSPVALVPRMMVAENPRPVMPEALMPGCPPDLCATRHAARHLEVTTACRPASGAVAWLPGDRDAARQPGMVATALQREAGPRKISVLLHAIIQTQDRVGSASILLASVYVSVI